MSDDFDEEDENAEKDQQESPEGKRSDDNLEASDPAEQHKLKKQSSLGFARRAISMKRKKRTTIRAGLFKKSKNTNIEYFEPINRKAEKLKTGDGLQSKLYKKVTRAKKNVVGSLEDNFD